MSPGFKDIFLSALVHYSSPFCASCVACC
jgi:hypothetical protein